MSTSMINIPPIRASDSDLDRVLAAQKRIMAAAFGDEVTPYSGGYEVPPFSYTYSSSSSSSSTTDDDDDDEFSPSEDSDNDSFEEVEDANKTGICLDSFEEFAAEIHLRYPTAFGFPAGKVLEIIQDKLDAGAEIVDPASYTEALIYDDVEEPEVAEEVVEVIEATKPAVERASRGRVPSHSYPVQVYLTVGSLTPVVVAPASFRQRKERVFRKIGKFGKKLVGIHTPIRKVDIQVIIKDLNDVRVDF